MTIVKAFSLEPDNEVEEVALENFESAYNILSFENKIFGITGNPENIFVLSKSWGVLSEKIFNEDGTYLINHSSSILLLRKGKYIDRISHHETEDNILKIIKKYL